jgi:predicted nucleic acid-binding protein
MRKLKIYLDTSVISHLDQSDKPSEHEYSHLFWESAKLSEYELFISETVIEELNGCKPEKAELLFTYLSEVAYTLLPQSEEARTLAAAIINRGILPKRSISDSLHVAYALMAECDYLLTWNMKHMANIYVNDEMRILTLETRHKPIRLIPPSMLIKEGGYEDDSES